MFTRTYYPSTAGSVIVPASAGVYPSGYAGSGYAGAGYAGSAYGVPAYSGSYYGGYPQTPMVINGSRSSRSSSVVVSQPMVIPPAPHTAVPYGYGGYHHAPAMPYYAGSAAPTVIMTGSSSSGSSRRHRRHSHSHHHRSRSHSRSRFWDF
jgi:hypothetical protein